MKVESMPLRFRVWDTISQSFFKNRSGGRIFSLLDLASVIGIPPMLTYLSGEWEISQSTGLKDKNGKEVFTGDILWRADKSYVVVYRSGKCMCAGVPQSSLAAMAKYGLVVGNIWENPELLKP